MSVTTPSTEELLARIEELESQIPKNPDAELQKNKDLLRRSVQAARDDVMAIMEWCSTNPAGDNAKMKIHDAWIALDQAMKVV